MKKGILETFLGFCFTIGGFALVFAALKELEKQQSPLLYLAGALLFIALGVFLIFKGGRQNIHKVKWDTTKDPAEKNQLTGILKKNNDLVKDYYKTNEARDRLKMLSLGDSEEKKSSF